MSDHVAKGSPLLSPEELDRIVDLFFEAGMLRKTPRSGWIFLGTGNEDVAQHSFRVAFMSYVLAKRAGANPARAALLGLFHDLHEARTSDLNYMNQRYVQTDQKQAQLDAVAGTGLEEDIVGALEEFEQRESPEARIAKDADQLDLLFNLKEELDKGNAFARDWIDAALDRLKTDVARAVARQMLQVDHSRWWYGRVDRRWWGDRCLPEAEQKTKRAVPGTMRVRPRSERNRSGRGRAGRVVVKARRRS